MAENKNFYKEMRRQLLGGYGTTRCEIDQTTSWSDGLDEASRFSPYLRRPLRRTDSVDDIERYYRYFSIARKNQGNQFTWKGYCNILLLELLNSDVLDALNKLSIQPSHDPAKSNGSNVPHIQRSVSSTKKWFEKRSVRKRSFLDAGSDVDSVSSSEGVRCLAPSMSVAKLVCDLCETAFTRSDNLKRHRRSHFVCENYDRICDICGKELSRVDSLRRHQRNLHEVAGLSNAGPSRFSNQLSATPIKLDASKRRNPGFVSSVRGLFENPTTKKRSLVDIEADVESIASSDDAKFHTPSKNVLKKMCTEIRTLAQKTCKTVEKMTTPAKYCSSCGDVIRSTIVHNKCSKHTGKSGYNKPLTPSQLNSTNFVKSRPLIFQSPSVKPVYAVDPRIQKIKCAPSFKM